MTVSLTIKNNNLSELLQQHQCVNAEIMNSGDADIVVEDRENNLVINGFEVEKPYHISDVIEKINSIAISLSKDDSVKIGEYIFYYNHRKITGSQGEVLLTDKEADIIKCLMVSEAAVDKNELLRRVWGYNSSVDTHTLETHIYRLRKKISDDFIATCKEGYSINILNK